MILIKPISVAWLDQAQENSELNSGQKDKHKYAPSGVTESKLECKTNKLA